jgi:hypothetical protein
MSPQVVRLNRVCFLHLEATSPRLSPGRYEARCRLGLLPNLASEEIYISASQSTGSKESESRRYTQEQLLELRAALPAPASAQEAAAAGPIAWVEIAAGPVVLVEQGPVKVVVHSTSGNWKEGLLFDCFTVLPLPGP